MTDAKRKVERALSALRDDVWTELQHRRVGKRVEEALAEAPRRRRWLSWASGGLAFAALAAAGSMLLISGSGSSPHDPPHAQRAPEAPPARTILTDGSVVEVGRGAQIRVLQDEPTSTRVEVISGRAEFEVEERQSRPFVAVIRGVEVRVVGTHFSAELDLTRPPGLVRVTVQRGVVEVAAGPAGRRSRLGAGDALEVSLSTAGEAGPLVESPSSATSTPAPSVPAPRPAPSGEGVPEAAKLFERANEARRAGDVSAAARAYASLLQHYPTDERVGVAALELGRLRMDALRSPAAAADAFRRAIAAAPSEGVREDALSRLIEVLDRMGDGTACLAEKRRYQARYPRGVHATSVAARCSTGR